MSSSAEHWLPIAEATRYLNRSDRTVRRWIADGRLPSMEGPHGLMVDVGGEVLVGEVTTPSAALSVPSAELAALSTENAELRAALVRAEALLEATAAERDRLLGLVGTALAARPALPPPAGSGRGRRWWPFGRRAQDG